MVFLCIFSNIIPLLPFPICCKRRHCFLIQSLFKRKKMKVIFQILLCTLLVNLLACSNSRVQQGGEPKEKTVSQQDNIIRLTEEEKDQSWELLFDGKSTDAWRGYNKDSFPVYGWSVKNGILGCSYKGADSKKLGKDIITKEQFENFELELEFLMGDSSNSGIFYLVQELDKPIYFSAPEYQLLDNKAFIFSDEDLKKHHKHLSGDNYALEGPLKDYTNEKGEWNKAKLKIVDKHVEHWLNGHKTADYVLGSEKWRSQVSQSKFSKWKEYGMATKGHIGLQDHGLEHEAWFRNIKIRKL